MPSGVNVRDGDTFSFGFALETRAEPRGDERRARRIIQTFRCFITPVAHAAAWGRSEMDSVNFEAFERGTGEFLGAVGNWVKLGLSWTAVGAS